MNELKEALSFIFLLASAIEKSLEDGKASLSDVPNFISPFIKAYAAFNGFNNIKAEIASMDDAKKAELLEWAKKEFDLSNDEVEQKIEYAMGIILNLAQLIFKIKG